MGTAFQSLSQSEFISHFGIAKVGDAIDKLHIKYAELKAKWSEIFEDVPFDEFSASEHNVAKDLAEYGISNEELESLSAKQDENEPKPVDDNEDGTEYDDEMMRKMKLVKRIFKRQELRKQYISKTVFDDTIATLDTYVKHWSNPNAIHLHSAILSSEPIGDDMFKFLQNDTSDSRFRPPIPRSNTHKIYTKTKVSKDKCKITDFVQLYCKVKPDGSDQIEEENEVIDNKKNKQKKDKAKKAKKSQREHEPEMDENN